jgi:hypothetical protein
MLTGSDNNFFGAIRAHCRHYKEIRYSPVPGYVDRFAEMGLLELVLIDGNDKETYRLTEKGKALRVR